MIAASCLAVYKSLSVLSDHTILFSTGMFIVCVPAMHHHSVLQRSRTAVRRLWRRLRGLPPPVVAASGRSGARTSLSVRSSM